MSTEMPGMSGSMSPMTQQGYSDIPEQSPPPSATGSTGAPPIVPHSPQEIHTDDVAQKKIKNFQKDLKHSPNTMEWLATLVSDPEHYNKIRHAMNEVQAELIARERAQQGLEKAEANILKQFQRFITEGGNSVDGT